MSHERVSLIRSLGAKVCPVSREQGGFNGSIRLTEQLARSSPHVFLPCQFSAQSSAQLRENFRKTHITRIKTQPFCDGPVFAKASLSDQLRFRN